MLHGARAERYGRRRPSWLSQLPDDLLIYICEHLGPRRMPLLCATSKRFQPLLEVESLWFSYAVKLFGAKGVLGVKWRWPPPGRDPFEWARTPPRFLCPRFCALDRAGWRHRFMYEYARWRCKRVSDFMSSWIQEHFDFHLMLHSDDPRDTWISEPLPAFFLARSFQGQFDEPPLPESCKRFSKMTLWAVRRSDGCNAAIWNLPMPTPELLDACAGRRFATWEVVIRPAWAHRWTSVQLNVMRDRGSTRPTRSHPRGFCWLGVTLSWDGGPRGRDRGLLGELFVALQRPELFDGTFGACDVCAVYVEGVHVDCTHN